MTKRDLKQMPDGTPRDVDVDADADAEHEVVPGTVGGPGPMSMKPHPVSEDGVRKPVPPAQPGEAPEWHGTAEPPPKVLLEKVVQRVEIPENAPDEQLRSLREKAVEPYLEDQAVRHDKEHGRVRQTRSNLPQGSREARVEAEEKASAKANASVKTADVKHIQGDDPKDTQESTVVKHAEQYERQSQDAADAMRKGQAVNWQRLDTLATPAKPVDRPVKSYAKSAADEQQAQADKMRLQKEAKAGFGLPDASPTGSTKPTSPTKPSSVLGDKKGPPYK